MAWFFLAVETRGRTRKFQLSGRLNSIDGETVEELDHVSSAKLYGAVAYRYFPRFSKHEIL